jgi:radical SAM protein with 4Fe4S-binding SPASM domain
MSRDMLMQVCKDCIDMGVRAINWTGGGEPWVNPNLRDAINYIGENSDIKMGMFTNGTLIDKQEGFEALVDNMTWVRFSIDSGTTETYESIRRAKGNQGWSKMWDNLHEILEMRDCRSISHRTRPGKADIGVGFVITPDTYTEILDFADMFKGVDVDYCQYKPEVVNREREGGIQRDIDFWKEKVEPLLTQAKEMLGKKFQLNGYHLDDLKDDPEFYGRTYKKCLGSQISPCIGADGEVYVCTNHRGYKEYSYGSLHERKFKDIWKDVSIRKRVMDLIEYKEEFNNCTKLCKPHESNKQVWSLYKKYNEAKDNGSSSVLLFEQDLLQIQEATKNEVQHPEFI